MIELEDEVLELIFNIQKKNPHILLCGSSVLMLKELLDKRSMSDIDFVCNREYLEDLNEPWIKDEYFKAKNHKHNYESLSCSYEYNGLSYKINMLVHDDSTKLYAEELEIPNMGKIKHQRLEDIIKWKEKYNRPKDIQDLDKILTKAIETTVLEENI